MKTLTESFQRQFVIRDFKHWVKTYAASFYPRSEIFLQNSNSNINSININSINNHNDDNNDDSLV